MCEAKPYFDPVLIGEEAHCLRHLDPIVLEFPTEARPKGVRIQVVFSNHCFSESYDSALHTDPVDIWDGGRRRVFDQTRYELSKGLPELMLSLPQAKVFVTPEANFMRLGNRPDGQDGEYRVYFHLKGRGAPRGVDLRLFVESAYSPNPGKVLPVAKLQKVRFILLVDKTLKGQSVKFSTKR